MRPVATKAELLGLGRLARAGERRTRGLLLAEGPRLLEEALALGMRVDLLAVADEQQAAFAGLLERAEAGGARVVLAPRERLDKVADAGHGPGLLAAVGLPTEAEWTPTREGPDGPAVLELALAGLQDPGNVGTLVRTAVAFGARMVHVGPGTADPWGPKALRSSAGAALRPGLLSRNGWERLTERAREQGLRLCTAVRPAPGHVAGDSAAELPPRALLVLGHETRGVPLLPGALPVGVPQCAHVDSLNVAVAGAVLAAGWYARHGSPA